MPARDPGSPQVLTTALTEQEAALIVDRLDELGIRAEIWRDDAATSAARGPGKAVDPRPMHTASFDV